MNRTSLIDASVSLGKYFIACFCLLLVFAGLSSAKEWRGIVPLRSTRADVHRVLGNPALEGKTIEGFDVDGVRVLVMYSVQQCQQGLPADWGNWNVPPDTVINISVPFAEEVQLADLKIPDIEKMKWYTDDAGFTYYHNKEEGLEYEVSREGSVRRITYGPTEKDGHLLCKKNAPVIRY